MTKDYMKYKKTLVEMKELLEKEWQHIGFNLKNYEFKDSGYDELVGTIKTYTAVCESLYHNTDHVCCVEEDE